MKKIIFFILLLAGVHFVSTAQDSKTKVDGSDYKRKVDAKSTHHSAHTAMYSHGVRRSYAAHHYRTHHPLHRHYAYRKHTYHRHIAHTRRHVYGKPVVHYKKVKGEGKKGEYKAKT